MPEYSNFAFRYPKLHFWLSHRTVDNNLDLHIMSVSEIAYKLAVNDQTILSFWIFFIFLKVSITCTPSY